MYIEINIKIFLIISLRTCKNGGESVYLRRNKPLLKKTVLDNRNREQQSIRPVLKPNNEEPENHIR